MDIINKIFELDLGKLVPEMGQVLDKARLSVTWAVMIGPILMLVLGLIYAYIPPKEANRKFGFRTYFGMGSVKAWRFTQKVAGLAFAALGLIFIIVMLIVISRFGKMDHFTMVTTAMVCLIWQLSLALIVRIGVSVLAAVKYDRNGNERKAKEK